MPVLLFYASRWQAGGRNNGWLLMLNSQMMSIHWLGRGRALHAHQLSSRPGSLFTNQRDYIRLAIFLFTMEATRKIYSLWKQTHVYSKSLQWSEESWWKCSSNGITIFHLFLSLSSSIWTPSLSHSSFNSIWIMEGAKSIANNCIKFTFGCIFQVDGENSYGGREQDERKMMSVSRANLLTKRSFQCIRRPRSSACVIASVNSFFSTDVAQWGPITLTRQINKWTNSFLLLLTLLASCNIKGRAYRVSWKYTIKWKAYGVMTRKYLWKPLGRAI